jgi:hypothetical protein
MGKFENIKLENKKKSYLFCLAVLRDAVKMAVNSPASW